jgi:thioredoxin reductase
MDARRIEVYCRTNIKSIRDREALLADARGGEERSRLENDFVFAVIGGERPTKFLQSLGVQIEGESAKSKASGAAASSQTLK